MDPTTLTTAFQASSPPFHGSPAWLTAWDHVDDRALLAAVLGFTSAVKSAEGDVRAPWSTAGEAGATCLAILAARAVSAEQDGQELIAARSNAAADRLQLALGSILSNVSKSMRKS